MRTPLSYTPLWTLLFASALGISMLQGCGDNTTTSSSTAGGGSGGSSSGTAGAPACNDGDCAKGSTCINGLCCEDVKVCGAACCSGAELCSFQQCVTPGAKCADASECGKDEYCELALGMPTQTMDPPGCMGGAVVPEGKCLPKPPICAAGDPGVGPDGKVTCLPKCENKPISDFTPKLKYSWGGTVAPPYDTDVVMMPVVIEMDDDDCDGKVTGNDIPEIAFVSMANSMYHAPGTLHVVSIKDGALVEKWTLPDAVYATGGLAAGDLDGDGVAEIIACAPPQKPGDPLSSGVVAFKLAGGQLTKLWEQLDTTSLHCGQGYPAVAIPQNDGTPSRVLMSGTLLDGKTGAIVKTLPIGNIITSFEDVNGDDQLDVVSGAAAYSVEGTKIWDLSSGPNAIPGAFHGVADLDKDGIPEVAVVNYTYPTHGSLSVLRPDKASPDGAKIIRNQIDIGSPGGGPPTIADFDGDGFPDVGIAGNDRYQVFSGKALMDPAMPEALLWAMPVYENQTSGAATGSAVFDFDGDGNAEVVYADEIAVHIFDGKTGKDLIPANCNTSVTLFEYPVVADVDNDGQADLVVPSNAFYPEAVCDGGVKTAGVRIYGSASGSWVRTRRVWNQHTYHITNINEDGTLPPSEEKNWLDPKLNNYRQNVEPGQLGAPDATILIVPSCGAVYGFDVTVRNLGEAPLPAGAVVNVHADGPSPVLLGSVTTTVPLYSAQAQTITLEVPSADEQVQSGATPVYGEIDAAWLMAAGVRQCRTDNDKSPKVSGACDVPE